MYKPDYQGWEACPLCSSDHRENHGTLPRERYWFGGRWIKIPDEGIDLYQCRDCDIFYKSSVPQPQDLSSILEAESGSVWSSDYRFEGVRRKVLEALGNPTSVHLLDVGSSNGSMLRTFSEVPGRRSALDVARNESCARAVNDEYIEGFLEGSIEWNNRPYEAITVCDLVEHLYDPLTAFERLWAFVEPGGIVFIQTGDGDYPRRERIPPSEWWYAGLFEHHIVWTEQSLSWASENVGFTLADCDRTRHKDRSSLPVWKKNVAKALRRARSVPGVRALARHLIDKEIRNLPDPSARDHLSAVLEKPAH